MDLQLVVAKPSSNDTGYTWTLASRLGDMLWRAEELYGSRDPIYTILGVEFRDGVPQIWFPGNRNHIIVQLSLRAIDNVAPACWQLAHECIHLLAPSPIRPASVLEEGLAVAFAKGYVHDHFQTAFQTGDERYDRAAELFDVATASDPSLARKLRDATGRFSGIRAEDILAVAPKLSTDLCQKLAREFNDPMHAT